jgi:hypothetical protein
MPKMFKTLSAALIAASVMLAPVAASANAAPAAKPVATKQVTMVKSHKRFVKHAKRGKFVKHACHYKKHFAHKRAMKVVKAHKRAHVVAAKARVRTN